MPELYPDDQKRVDDYLARTEREPRGPFRPWLLFSVIIAVLAVLTAIAFTLGEH